MKTGAPRFFRRSFFAAAAGILTVVLTACTGRGGGQLPPQSPVFGPVFAAPASFGFSFSCEDSGGLNQQTGRLRTQLSYTDHGSNPIGSSFSIHGIVDTVDPLLESAVCIGQEPAPGGLLTFLGRYYLTSSAPADFPSTCPTRESTTTPLCRFEVAVQDKDRNLAPSPGDFFQIKLSTATTPCTSVPLDLRCSKLGDDPDEIVFYTRAGFLSSGNLTVD